MADVVVLVMTIINLMKVTNRTVFDKGVLLWWDINEKKCLFSIWLSPFDAKHNNRYQFIWLEFLASDFTRFTAASEFKYTFSCSSVFAFTKGRSPWAMSEHRKKSQSNALRCMVSNVRVYVMVRTSDKLESDYVWRSESPLRYDRERRKCETT